MSENNKSYRIRTNVGSDSYITVNLEQDYDSIDILSLKINGLDSYVKHDSKYGVVVGRVTANNGFGVPNAKISIFVESETPNANEIDSVYPFRTTVSKDNDGVRYNLLPDNKVSDCHQVVGTFPNKRFMLDNNILVEVFDKYYKYTTRTNNAGDYMIACVPVGQQTIHMDLDLSDCGILSQRPRDFVYKGYNIEQFENPNQFKTGTDYGTLSQVFSQDQVVYVKPFWGNQTQGEMIGITRADIEIAYKFEPTCVFMGCVVSDNSSQGISKNCVPTEHMGDMDELVTGKGRIEMIRKTYTGDVEEFQINGTELINGEGIWCYQIPMNLDYMVTDEYGKMVPTDNPERGIPTRTRVRFRMSMEDMEENTDNYFRAKVLVPHNPQSLDGTKHEEYDYEFGTHTKDESFRDLFWNNVYTVKSYIPRFQKSQVVGWRQTKFTGIKHCQDHGSNNPIPYNNIRIKLPFMFRMMCILIKIFIKIVAVYNWLVCKLAKNLYNLAIAMPTILNILIVIPGIQKLLTEKMMEIPKYLRLNVIEDGLCPDLENWYFAPMIGKNNELHNKVLDVEYDLLSQTLEGLNDKSLDDTTSIDFNNDENNPSGDSDVVCITTKTDYLISCIEMNLAQEYKVINFDFYNDWVNGMIYIPRWMRYIRLKKRFRGGGTLIKSKTKACMDNTRIFAKTRRYTQLCSLAYKKQSVTLNNTTQSYTTYTKLDAGNINRKTDLIKANNYHKKKGFSQVSIFGINGGICHEKETMVGQYVYYLKPCEWLINSNPKNKKVNLFATDLVLLGSLNDCDIYGVPQAFRYLSSTSYIMPTNLALTNMETDGMLYAYGDNKTICQENNQSPKDSNNGGDNTIFDTGVVLADQTLTSELRFFSGANENYDVDYDGNDFDTMPMTEAAGIAWNYTGPGQNEKIENQLYYPGGHFLGISCLNSQTNIKSCVNLERICEQGVVMSQRKVDVRAVDSGTTNEVFKYVYTAPSGLISKDEIIDDYFRTMFATMNQNRLIATKMNRETGYMVYDFQYVNPVNFSGELSKYTQQNTPYNTDVSVSDESQALAAYNIANGSGRADFDDSESAYTQIRTIEDTSVDYYRFRLGLDYGDLKNNTTKHKRKFAVETNNQMYLPQYENSYYFYFGLHAGSTAIDEFNKQFFSQCENNTLSQREGDINITVGDFDLCAGTAHVIVAVINMESPYTYRIYDINGNVVSSITSNNVIEEFDLSNGQFQITVNDSNGFEITDTIYIAEQLLQGNFTYVDFNNDITHDYGGAVARTTSNSNIFYGGAVIVNNLHINDNIALYGFYALKAGCNPNIEPAEIIEYIEPEELLDEHIYYLASANTYYDIYISYIYEEECSENYLFVNRVMLNDTSVVNLKVGAGEQHNVITDTMYQDNWWKGRYTEPINTSLQESVQRWNIRKAITNSVCNSADTNSNYVYTNGSKFVFGSPQNYAGILTGNTLYIDGYMNPPAGYTVDDDYSYYPTYGITGYSDVRQFSCMSYLGSVVHGSFAGTISGQTGYTKTMQPVTGLINRLRSGDGCIFKSLPEGNLYPAIAESGTTGWTVRYVNPSTSQTDGWNAESVGIVYPTICYPSVNRRLKANINYFVCSITTPINSETIGTDRFFVRCDGIITNGLTYNGYYSDQTTIDVVTNGLLANLTELNREPYDLSGVTETTSIPMELIISGISYNDLDEAVDTIPVGTSYSYNIIEGYPRYVKTSGGTTTYSAKKMDNTYQLYDKYNKYIPVVSSVELDVNGNFYDSIYYYSGLTTIFGGSGVADYDIEYYAIPKYFTYTDEHYLSKKSSNERRPDEIYVLVQYGRTISGLYNEGDYTVLRFSKVGLLGGNYNAYYYDVDPDNPNELIEIELTGISSDSGEITLDKIDNMTESAFAAARFGDPTITKITGTKYEYNVNPSINFNTSNGVIPWLHGAYKITNGEFQNLDFDFCVVAVKQASNTTNTANSKLCMIYLSPLEVNSIDDIHNILN